MEFLHEAVILERDWFETSGEEERGEAGSEGAAERAIGVVTEPAEGAGTKFREYWHNQQSFLSIQKL